MSKITMLCILVYSLSIHSNAQYHLTKYENYSEPTLINPAITGSEFIPKATISYSRQLMNVSQSPSSFYLSAQMRLGKYDDYNPRMFLNKSKFESHERVGLGAGFYADNYGPFSEYN